MLGSAGTEAGDGLSGASSEKGALVAVSAQAVAASGDMGCPVVDTLVALWLAMSGS